MATPQDDSYSCPVDGVVAAGRYRLWSSDNTPGSFDAGADTWTPGRGADGRVTAASWSLVPTGRWVKVSGTRMDSLDAVVKSALPNWSDRGNSGWNGVTGGWSGMALDAETAGQPRAWIFGGGHHDSSNNGLYRLDLHKMGWSVEILPTDLTGCDARYTTGGTVTFTSYPAAADYEAANPSQSIVYRDELYPFAPGKPTSRHTYSSLVFDNATQRIITGVSRLWMADIAAKTWSKRMPFDTNVGSYAPLTGLAFENTCGFLYGRKYVILGTQAGNMSQAWEYDIDAQTFAWRTGLPGGWLLAKSQSCKVGDTLYTFHPSFETTNRFIVSNLAAKTKVEYNLASSSALTDVMRTDYDGGGMTYIPEVGKLLLATKSVSTNKLRLYWIDPVTRTIDFASIPGNFPTSPHDIVENKIQYVPQIKAVLHIDRASDDVRILRF